MLPKMATSRPKACEMAGFDKNWDTEDLVEAAEERTVNLQQRMQEEKTERGENSGERALQPRKERVGFATFEEGNDEGLAEQKEYNTDEEGKVQSRERINGGVNEDEEEIGEYMNEHQDSHENKVAHSAHRKKKNLKKTQGGY